MNISTQIYSNAAVPAKCGTVATITVEQTLSGGGGAGLIVEGTNTVQVLIDGPQTRLNGDDIAGVYPAAGSDESADEYLPHIALSRRTLPWDRYGIDQNNERPWLALVLFRESELNAPSTQNPQPKGAPEPVKVSDIAAKDPLAHTALNGLLGADAPVTVLYVRNEMWRRTRPAVEDLRYLTHMRKTSFSPGGSRYASVVISNRLPYAGNGEEPAEMHTACLISLEDRGDLWDGARNVNGNTTALLVLHHWKFRPSKGGDFEQVIRSIRYRPNGGVLRFGNLPQEGESAPLSGGFDAALDPDGYFREAMAHAQPGNVTWRSPLRPFPPPPRVQGFAIRPAPEEFDDQSGELDYSHATAFELGRLLALNNPGILDDLRNIKAHIPEIELPVLANSLPPALQRPDWVQNPAWFEKPWTLQNQISMVKDQAALLEQYEPGDIGGLGELPGQWQNQPFIDLEALPAVPVAPVIQVDVGTVSSGNLGKIFADVEGAAHGG